MISYVLSYVALQAQFGRQANMSTTAMQAVAYPDIMLIVPHSVQPPGFASLRLSASQPLFYQPALQEVSSKHYGSLYLCQTHCCAFSNATGGTCWSIAATYLPTLSFICCMLLMKLLQLSCAKARCKPIRQHMCIALTEAHQ